MKLDLGSGYTRKPGFLRVDADFSVDPDYLLDLRKLKGFKNSSVEEINSSHALEHVALNETFSTLREWWRVLVPGGILTITVPDCGWAMREWSRGRLKDCCLLKTILGSDPGATEWMAHKNIFWDKRLERFLYITGFVNIDNLSVKNSGELVFRAKKPGR
jgi:hypothetical protein